MEKYEFLHFWALILKMYHFCGCNIFFSPSSYPINSMFLVSVCSYNMFLMKHFSSNYQNAYGHQTFQGGDIIKELSPINMHDISMEWSCWVKGQIKYIYPPAKDVSGRCWHSVRGSQTWPFDQVTKMRSRDCLQNLNLYFHEVYS